ncbi:MAG TPA: C39 family peptidase [Micromonosporaceae bacterium]
MSERDIRIDRWTTAADFGTGTADGVSLTAAGLIIERAVGTLSRTDRFLGSTTTYEYATWTSPTVEVGFAVAEMIPSFTASTPGRSWISIELRADDRWFDLGEWAADDTEISRTSIGGQAAVRTDVLVTPLTSWQIRVRLLRPVGGTDAPVVHTIGAVATGPYDAATDTPSAPGTAIGSALAVPQFSQRVHAGRYPQWADGGGSWCSPTSVSMVAAFWKTGPTEADYAWVDPTYADPQVIHAARSTYDHAYAGCGNWVFNTAYAGRFGLDAFVTRLRSLRDAEAFIAAGIPLVVSAAYEIGDVPGVDYRTSGHLLVIVGFTDDGDPIVNDPAAIDNAAVRKVFGRAEFEAAWRRASGGVTYVIRPPDVALPTTLATR